MSTPYRRLDCSLISDGAAALVIAHPGEAPNAPRRTRIAGSGCASDRLRLGDRTEPHRFAAKADAARAAYAEAGITHPVRDIQLAEVYDAFTGAELQGLEALGLCGEGEAGPAMAEGRFDVGGALAVNSSGGLIGQGAAPGATGVMPLQGEMVSACFALVAMDGADNLSFARLQGTQPPPREGDRVRLTPVSGPVPHPAQGAVFVVTAGDGPGGTTRGRP